MLCIFHYKNTQKILGSHIFATTTSFLCLPSELGISREFVFSSFYCPQIFTISFLSLTKFFYFTLFTKMTHSRFFSDFCIVNKYFVIIFLQILQHYRESFTPPYFLKHSSLMSSWFYGLFFLAITVPLLFLPST